MRCPEGLSRGAVPETLKYYHQLIFIMTLSFENKLSGRDQGRGKDQRAEEAALRRFGGYRELYQVIRERGPDALERFKRAVQGMDWNYRMSDDLHCYSRGAWQEQTLTTLAKMLGKAAEKWWASEKRRKLV